MNKEAVGPGQDPAEELFWVSLVPQDLRPNNPRMVVAGILQERGFAIKVATTQDLPKSLQNLIKVQRDTFGILIPEGTSGVGFSASGEALEYLSKVFSSHEFLVLKAAFGGPQYTGGFEPDVEPCGWNDETKRKVLGLWMNQSPEEQVDIVVHPITDEEIRSLLGDLVDRVMKKSS